MSWSQLSGQTRKRLRLAVFQRDGGVCQLQLPGCTVRATVADHIRPREIAGDGLDNLQAACWFCNGSKGDPRRSDPDPLPFA